VELTPAAKPRRRRPSRVATACALPAPVALQSFKDAIEAAAAGGFTKPPALSHVEAAVAEVRVGAVSLRRGGVTLPVGVVRASSVATYLKLPGPLSVCLRFARCRPLAPCLLLRRVPHPRSPPLPSRPPPAAQGYKATDEALLRQCAERGLDYSSCTSVTAVVAGDLLSVAHLGDSKIVLGREGAGGVLVGKYLTLDHKPDMPEERARIERVRGKARTDISGGGGLRGGACGLAQGSTG